MACTGCHIVTHVTQPGKGIPSFRMWLYAGALKGVEGIFSKWRLSLNRACSIPGTPGSTRTRSCPWCMRLLELHRVMNCPIYSHQRVTASGVPRTGRSSMGCPLSPLHMPRVTPVSTAEGSHLERFVPAFCLCGSDISGNTHRLLRLSPRREPWGHEPRCRACELKAAGEGTSPTRKGQSWSNPRPILQDPLFPGQLAAARHRNHHHRLVAPDQGCAEQRLGPGPAGRAAPPAPSRV